MAWCFYITLTTPFKIFIVNFYFITGELEWSSCSRGLCILYKTYSRPCMMFLVQLFQSSSIALSITYLYSYRKHMTLQWRNNGRDGVSNHQPHDCLLNHLFRRRSKKNIKAPHHWPLCVEFTGDRWIPRTNGQLRGKCFHLMTSSWSHLLLAVIT